MEYAYVSVTKVLHNSYRHTRTSVARQYCEGWMDGNTEWTCRGGRDMYVGTKGRGELLLLGRGEINSKLAS